MSPFANEQDLREAVRAWLREDIGRGDVTTRSTVPAEAKGRAEIVTRSPAVVAGSEIARACFQEVDPGVAWYSAVKDGGSVRPGDTLASVEGPLPALLTAERTALNLLAHLSGIATASRAFAEAVAGTDARVIDTRKTTPGLRVVEKYAVRVGGCHNHRFGLDDGILIKDNHIAAVGGIGSAVARARSLAPHGLAIEVEVVDMDGLEEAITAGADGVLLDNMSPSEVAAAVERSAGRVWLEASGGITLDNVRDFALTGVTLISAGALTHSAPHIDLSMEVDR